MYFLIIIIYEQRQRVKEQLGKIGSVHSAFDQIWGSEEECKAYERPSTRKMKSKSRSAINSKHKNNGKNMPKNKGGQRLTSSIRYRMETRN